MEIVYILAPASVLLGVVALAAYWWAARNGQFDDLDTPAHRILFDDIPAEKDPDRSRETK